MIERPDTDEEQNRALDDRSTGHRAGSTSPSVHRGDSQKRKALRLTVGLAVLLLLITATFVAYLITLSDELPSFEQLDNPYLRFATVAYTADGEQLGVYGAQHRTWISYEDISPHVINALIASEDHRFYDHWGVDLFRTVSAVLHTLLGDTQGGSTITQQLARNLYNEQIGKEQTPSRKLKEMVTAVQLERRYTKQEIIEMYLNTVEFGSNAWGIEMAARTYFNKSAAELNVAESALLVGILRTITYYNPLRYPDRAKWVRNVVLSQMVKHGFIASTYLDTHRDDPLGLDYNPASSRGGVAPFFASYVGEWLKAWGAQTGHDIETEGLTVYTTLDSRLQRIAQQAVDREMEGLQAVVDYEWALEHPPFLSPNTDDYLHRPEIEPFDFFWRARTTVVDAFVMATPRYRALRQSGMESAAAVAELRQDQAFMDSLKAARTRLEAGLVAIDPYNGQVRVWIGGRDPGVEWYDHVFLAKRQPGSTFKLFAYTAAIDNGYSPDYRLPDSAFVYFDPETREVWEPNSAGAPTGEMLSLREALAESNNRVTARVATQLVNPAEIVQYATRMGIQSPLDPVPSIALGTSDVTLLELTSAYCTIANGGLYYAPTVVTRIEDRYGAVLYEAPPVPVREALSPETAYTVLDMLRGVVERGTGTWMRTRFGLYDQDLAGKTGTSQDGADGWFVVMHPQLVIGAWVGFNDRRITFRSEYWGQGGHNALLLVGAFLRDALLDEDNLIDPEASFPSITPGTGDRDSWVGW